MTWESRAYRIDPPLFPMGEAFCLWRRATQICQILKQFFINTNVNAINRSYRIGTYLKAQPGHDRL